MTRARMEESMILAFIGGNESGPAQAVAEKSIVKFMKELGMNKGIIDFEIISLVERGLIRTVKNGRYKYFKVTKKGNKYSKNIIIVN